MASHVHYVDYAGSAVPTKKQLDEVAQLLSKNAHVNPHSASLSGDDYIDDARSEVLKFCNASPGSYQCIFTSGATDSFQLLARAFPWTRGRSCYAYAVANHTSVLAMRQIAADQGADVIPIVVSSSADATTVAPARADECVADAAAAALSDCMAVGVGSVTSRGTGNRQAGNPTSVRTMADATHHHLLALPAECNVTGTRCAPATIMRLLHSKAQLPDTLTDPGARALIVLDAAKAAQTCPPDLSTVPVHFVALSFYKVFGYPTGLGALLVRSDCLPLLRPPYLGGGTIRSTLPASWPSETHAHDGVAAFEPGTPNFLAIKCLRAGFRAWHAYHHTQLGRPHGLARALAARLLRMRHAAGHAVCNVYGWHDLHRSCRASRSARSCAARRVGIGELGSCGPNPPSGPHEAARARSDSPTAAAQQGPVVAFNVWNGDGDAVSSGAVQQVLSSNGVLVRAGCCCNTGACAAVLGVSDDQLTARHGAGWSCGGGSPVMSGRHTGVVRASFGYLSTDADVDAIVRVVADAFGSFVVPRCLEADSPNSNTSPPGIREHALAPERVRDSVVAGAHWGSDLEGAEATPLQSGTIVSAERDSTVAQWCDGRLQLDAAHPRGTDRLQWPLGHAYGAPGAHAAHGAAGLSEMAAAAFRTPPASRGSSAAVHSLYVYPVKSCRGVRVVRWPLTRAGLALDRAFAVVDASVRPLTCRHKPQLLLIEPIIDLDAGTLRLRWHEPEGCQRGHCVATSGHEAPHVPRTDDGACLCTANSCAVPLPMHLWRSAQFWRSPVTALAKRDDAVAAASAPPSPHLEGECTVAIAGVRRPAAFVPGVGKAGSVHAWLSSRLDVECYLVHLLDEPNAEVHRACSGGGPSVPPTCAVAFVGEGSPLLAHDTPADGAAPAALPAVAQGCAAASFANAGALLVATTGSANAFAAEARCAQRSPEDEASTSKPHTHDMCTDSESASDVQEAALRFRVNMLVTGMQPHAEDGWQRLVVETLQGGHISLNVTGRAVRCSAVSCNWRHGSRDTWRPLQVLSKYRVGSAGVTWGVYAAPSMCAAHTMSQLLADRPRSHPILEQQVV